MGIDLNAAQLLILEHKKGLSLGRMVTLGRQGLHANRPALISVLRKSGYVLSKERYNKLLDPTTEYAEDLFSLLGAKDVVAIDVSNYEGAQIIHDMNRPITGSMLSSFDFVLDSGTLEHVFDFPTALRNAVQMVRPNGRFMSITMANNFCGHGFYQLSPELFYRFLCPINGYVMEACILWEDIPGSRFYRVPDLDSINSRIDLTSEYGTYLMVKANRVGNILNEFAPQQSDYVRLWSGDAKLDGCVSKFDKALTVFKKALFIRNAAMSFYAKVRYRRLRISRNTRSILTPLKELRVHR